MLSIVKLQAESSLHKYMCTCKCKIMGLSSLLNAHIYFLYVQCSLHFRCNSHTGSLPSNFQQMGIYVHQSTKHWVWIQLFTRLRRFAFICMGDLYISASWSCLGSSLIEHHTYMHSLYSAELAPQIVVIIPCYKYDSSTSYSSASNTSAACLYNCWAKTQTSFLLTLLRHTSNYEECASYLYMDQHKGTTIKRHVH